MRKDRENKVRTRIRNIRSHSTDATTRLHLSLIHIWNTFQIIDRSYRAIQSNTLTNRQVHILQYHRRGPYSHRPVSYTHLDVYKRQGLDMPSQQYIHGQRQQIQNRPCTCYLGEQIAARSIYTCPRAETVFQKAISRYAVLTPVKRHKVTSTGIICLSFCKKRTS